MLICPKLFSSTHSIISRVTVKFSGIGVVGFLRLDFAGMADTWFISTEKDEGECEGEGEGHSLGIACDVLGALLVGLLGAFPHRELAAFSAFSLDFLFFSAAIASSCSILPCFHTPSETLK